MSCAVHRGYNSSCAECIADRRREAAARTHHAAYTKNPKEREKARKLRATAAIDSVQNHRSTDKRSRYDAARAERGGAPGFEERWDRLTYMIRSAPRWALSAFAVGAVILIALSYTIQYLGFLIVPVLISAGVWFWWRRSHGVSQEVHEPRADGATLVASPAAWFDDPSDANRLRWWDGQEWTEATLPRRPD